MTKDEILQALRLTSMGRAGHPLQEQLAEKLAEALAFYDETAKTVADLPIVEAEAPKRRKKAD